MAKKKNRHPGVHVVEHVPRKGAEPRPVPRWKDPVTGKRRNESLRGLSKADREARLVESRPRSAMPARISA